MEAIVSIFWNSQERRLRLAWRMILWVILLIALSVFAVLCASAILFGVLLASGDLSLAEMSPSEAQELINNAAGGGQGTTAFLISSVLNFALTVLSVWLAGRFLDRRVFADFGFRFNRQWWADLGFGMALGAVLMAAIFGVELAAGWVAVTGTVQTSGGGIPFVAEFGLMIVVFLGVGINEELFSRGYMLKNFAEGLNFSWLRPGGAILISLLISSAVFGLLHAANPNASTISTINLVAAGVFLAVGYLLTGELAVSIGLHFTWNLFQGNVFGFPVSGLDAGPTFIAVRQAGPDLWTGGEFGPEAGLIGIAAILTGILLIVLWVRLTRGRLGLHTALAVPTLLPPKAASATAIGGDSSS